MPRFELVKCTSGFTLRESLNGQLMHSDIGPWIEANTVYVGPSELEKRLSAYTEAPLVLYDVGMGTAANAIAAINISAQQRRKLKIISFEKYPNALEQILSKKTAFPYLMPLGEALRTLLQSGSAEIAPHISWNLIKGDFRDLDLSALPKADLIYFDFYSPGTCPDLWTQAVFQKLFEKSCPDTMIFTYAAGKSVRSAMLLAGFYVGAGPSTEMKRETTVATRNSTLLKSPLTGEWLRSLERSSRPFPVDIAERNYPDALEKVKTHPQFRQTRSEI